MTISKTSNKDLMTKAREALKDKWLLAIGVTACSIIIPAIISTPDFGAIFSFIISGPFKFGMALFFLTLITNKNEAKFPLLFSGFSLFVKTLLTYLATCVFFFLWLALFIVPGIIKIYSYSMTFFILTENPSLKPLEAITKSRELMDGNKTKLMYLHCRFTGWLLLGILSCGIGFIWIIPYLLTAHAAFYQDIK
jgi:uncharacterized membrane protein